MKNDYNAINSNNAGAVLGASVLTVFTLFSLALVSCGYPLIVFAINRWFSLGDLQTSSLLVAILLALCIGPAQLIAEFIAVRVWRSVFMVLTRHRTADQPRLAQMACSTIVWATIACSIWLLFNAIFVHWQASVLALIVVLFIEKALALVKSAWEARKGGKDS